MTRFKQFVPVVAMVVMAVAQAVQKVIVDGWSGHSVLVVVVAGLGAVATYFVPSVSDRAPWAKTVVAALLSAAVVLQDATASGSFDGQVILTAVIAAIGVIVTAVGEPQSRDYVGTHARAA